MYTKKIRKPKSYRNLYTCFIKYTDTLTIQHLLQTDSALLFLLLYYRIFSNKISFLGYEFNRRWIARASIVSMDIYVFDSSRQMLLSWIIKFFVSFKLSVFLRILLLLIAYRGIFRMIWCVVVFWRDFWGIVPLRECITKWTA